MPVLVLEFTSSPKGTKNIRVWGQSLGSRVKRGGYSIVDPGCCQQTKERDIAKSEKRIPIRLFLSICQEWERHDSAAI